MLAIGADALSTCQTGSGNVAIGRAALISATSGANIGIGYHALLVL